MKKSHSYYITQAAIIGALYVVLTFIANGLGLASGAVQIRLSEILTIMPLFTWAAVPGLTVGCLLANMLTGCALWDVVFGTIATFIGAMGTYLVREKKPILGPLFPILSNALIVPLILRFAYGIPGSYLYFFATVGAGELICCGFLGLLLYRELKKTNIYSSDR